MKKNYRRGYRRMAKGVAVLALLALLAWGGVDFAAGRGNLLSLSYTKPQWFAISVGGVVAYSATLGLFYFIVEGVHRLAGWLGGELTEKELKEREWRKDWPLYKRFLLWR